MRSVRVHIFILLLYFTLSILGFISHFKFVGCQIILAPKKLKLDGQDKLLLLQTDNQHDTANGMVNLSLSFAYDFKVVKYQTVVNFKEPFQEWILPYNQSMIKHDMFPLIDSIYIKAVFWSSNKPSKTKGEVIELFDVATDWGSGFFQSDKQVYRPGETVRFRFLRLNETFHPMTDRCELVVKNPQNIKIDAASLESRSPFYYADYSFGLPSVAKNGQWSAHLDCDNKYTDSLTFSVRDYVAPIFQIQLDTPSVHLCSSDQIVLGLNVTYTYGKPVDGYVFFRFGVQKMNRKNFQHKLTTQVFCLEKGLLKQTIAIGDICSTYSFKMPARLVIETVVTDSATDLKEQSKSDSTILSHFPYKISTKRFTTQVYKPNVSNYIAFEVVDFDGNPIGNVPLKISIIDETRNQKILPYVLQGSSSVLDDGQTLVNTDSNGMVVFSFLLKQTYGTLIVNIRGADPKYGVKEQPHSTIRLKPFDFSGRAGQNCVVLLSNKKRIFYQAGQSFRSSIVYSGPVDLDRVYLLIMKDDLLLHWQKIRSDHIDVTLTNRMAPSIQFLILAFNKQTKQIVTDFFRILIQQNNCGVQLSLAQNSSKIIEPGDNLTIILKGSKDDVLALAAIDQSIRILADQINQNQGKKERLIFQKILPISDAKVRKYYQAEDSVSLIQHSGFHILSAESHDDLHFLSRSTRPKRFSIPGDLAETECDKYRHELCCKLASSVFKKKVSCEKNYQVLLEHLKDKKCAQIFLVCCRCSTRRFQPSVSLGSSVDIRVAMMPPLRGSPFAEQEDEEDIEAREDFRDTWLFDLIKLNNSSEIKISRSVPDSITSWIISSTSLTKKDGFCINGDAKVTVFKSFFIHVSVPKSIVLFEKTEIAVTIFNYHNQSLTTRLYFYHVDGICSDAYQSLSVSRTEKAIAANSSESFNFPIIPIKMGHFQIKIKAISSKWKDLIVKNLTVLAPGITKEQSLSLDLDPTNKAKRETFTQREDDRNKIVSHIYPDKRYQNIEISLNNFDENIVPGTVRHYLSLVGRRFQPLLKSPEQLAHLIKRPGKGCGEQSAFYIAFNLYTLRYLSRIGRLNSTTRNRGVKYMKRALHELMNYYKDDGSFSAFVGRDSSLWLTGFVVKILCQSMEFLNKNVDQNALQNSLNWITMRQEDDGSWTDMNTLHHRHADGGSNRNINTRTAHLLIGLQTCKSYFQQSSMSDYHRERAEDFILRQLKIEKDSHTQAIMLYSLLLSSSSHFLLTENVRNTINSLIHHQDRRIDLKMKQLHYDHPLFSMETSSYVLLCLNRLPYDNKEHSLERLMLANWLSSRPFSETLGNTQDTLLALQALADYYGDFLSTWSNDFTAQNHHGDDHSLFANVSLGRKERRAIQFSPEHDDVWHSIEVDPEISSIKIETIGDGFGRLELLTVYNVFKPTMHQCYFDLKVDLFEETIHYVQEDFDISIFFDQDLQRKMSIERMPKSLDMFQTNPKNVCQSMFKRTQKPKATIFNEEDNQYSELGVCQYQLSSQSSLASLSNVENPVIKVMKICAKRLEEDRSKQQQQEKPFIHTVDPELGIVILEISLLSGYSVVQEDLHSLKNHSLIEWFSLAGSKLTIYLSNVPEHLQLCLCLRIYQERSVEFIQSALVQIYSYFKKDSKCQRLYNEISERSYWNYTCNDNACRCLIGEKCPQNWALREIEDKFTKGDYFESYRLFKEVLCKYQLVMISHAFRNTTTMVDGPEERGQFFQIEPHHVLKGNNSDAVTMMKFRMYPECWLDLDQRMVMSEHARFPILLMIDLSNDFDQPTEKRIVQLDGKTVFYKIDENRRTMFNEFTARIQYENDICS